MGHLARTGLEILNHRGEAAHGIAYIDNNTGAFELRTRLGLVRDTDIFHRMINSDFLIGHTRYGTSGPEDIANAQPFKFVSRDMIEFALSHNGNITNDEEIRQLMRGNGAATLAYRSATTDSVVIGQLLEKVVRRGSLQPRSIADALSPLIGSYSLAILVGGTDPAILAIRDKEGRMPLSVGENTRGFFVASESVAFEPDFLNAPNNREVKPGELVIVRKSGFESYQLFDSDGMAKQICTFQWVYMAREDTTIAGANVANVRGRLGEVIARNYRPQVDYVVPILDSGLPGAVEYSNASGVPLRIGIKKNRYMSSRTFQAASQQEREVGVENKHSVLSTMVEGRRVLVIDDSLVRGTTTSKLVSKLRAKGAKEVHLAFTFPAIISACVFGIDFYNDQLLARRFMDMPEEERNRDMAEKIRADSVYFVKVPDLVETISREGKGITRDDLCVSCLTGVYRPSEIRVVEEGVRRGGVRRFD